MKEGGRESERLRVEKGRINGLAKERKEWKEGKCTIGEKWKMEHSWENLCEDGETRKTDRVEAQQRQINTHVAVVKLETK